MSYTISKIDKKNIYQNYGVKITSENGIIKYTGGERQKEIVSGIINKKIFLANNSGVKLDNESKKGSISENLYQIGFNAPNMNNLKYSRFDFDEKQDSYSIS